MGESGDDVVAKEPTGVMGAWWATGATCVEMLRESLGFAERATLEGNISTGVRLKKAGLISRRGSLLVVLAGPKLTAGSKSRVDESSRGLKLVTEHGVFLVKRKRLSLAIGRKDDGGQWIKKNKGFF